LDSSPSTSIFSHNENNVSLLLQQFSAQLAQKRELMSYRMKAKSGYFSAKGVDSPQKCKNGSSTILFEQ